mmetsp:Transcript_40501/g.29846  ORF Transcript_40501/g.29846 Transcript_40501/m.29846 type:complete len:133 (+) Transcript_40501:591-989(+)
MLKQQGVTTSGDVYQIGVVLYEMLVGLPPYYNNNIKVLYQNIQKGKLTVPKYVSSDAKKFLLKLLNKDPKKRPKLADIKKEPFLSGIDWVKLAQKKIKPPSVLSRANLKDDEEEKMSKDSNLEMIFEKDENF